MKLNLAARLLASGFDFVLVAVNHCMSGPLWEGSIVILALVICRMLKDGVGIQNVL